MGGTLGGAIGYGHDMPTEYLEIDNDDAAVWIERPDTSRGGYYSHLHIDSAIVFEFGAPCGTCGVLFRKVSDAVALVSDVDAPILLGDLSELPDVDAIRRLSAPLGTGHYEVRVFEAVPMRTVSGDTHDFFLHEQKPLNGWSHAEDESRPGTSYYRFGADVALPAAAWSGTFPALLLQLVVPLFDEALADEVRIQHWIDRADAGDQLTAMAITVVDQQSPAMDAEDEEYAYREHRALVHYLLDGHHRAIAAARTGRPLRVLSFVSREGSLADPASYRDSIDRLARG